MYSLDVDERLRKKFLKLAKRNRNQLNIIDKKVVQIRNNPHRYKNLRAPLNHWKRVHIDEHFVLVFSIDETTKTVILEDFDHHDNIYI